MRWIFAAVMLMSSGLAHADDVVLAPEDFLREAFPEKPPLVQSLWLDDAIQARLKPILEHSYPAARLRYWRIQNRTAWILEDVGKEFPITAGFVVNDGAIETARVLIYRESRGDEIRYPRFLKQFSGARLRDGELAQDIDGISGATLSVAAMKRMARAALLLTSLVK